jgi:hypothetical protein
MVQSIYLHVSQFQQLCKGVSTHVEDWITRTGVESLTQDGKVFRQVFWHLVLGVRP